MGFLRLLLAISVVVYHRDVRVHFLVGGLYAVKLFFIISGFYMALILHEKYTGAHAKRLFYCNRLLRLLPSYYVILGLFLVTPWLGGLFLGRPITFGNLNYWKLAGANLPEWLSLSLNWLHVTPLGQELPWAGVFDLTSRTVQFQTPPNHQSLKLFSLLLLPPAWSLSLELQFYAFAPYVVRRSVPVLAGILASGLILRWFLLFLPASNNFYGDYTLVGNLGYFVLGIVCYRIYRMRTGLAWMGWLADRGSWFLVFLSAWFAAFPWLPEGWRELVTTGGFAFALPFVFAATSTWHWDRMLGELSYPLYLCHWLVNDVWYGLEAYAQKRIPAFQQGWVNVVVVVIASGILALALRYVVERPIDRFRQRLVRRRLPSTPRPGP